MATENTTKDSVMNSKTTSEEQWDQGSKVQTLLESYEGSGKRDSCPDEEVSIVRDIEAQEDQQSTRSLMLEGQRIRPRTRKGISTSLENIERKRNRAGENVKSRISCLDQMLREQCTDIVKLTAAKDGLIMEMDDLRRFHEEVIDLLLVNPSNENFETNQRYFENIRYTYLECCADVKTKIADLSQERLEMLSQRSRISHTISTAESYTSKVSKTSAVSSRQAAANAAGLKEKMASLIKQQELDQKREELKTLQRELDRQEAREMLQGEIRAAEAFHETLLDDSNLLSNGHTVISPAPSKNTALTPHDNIEVVIRKHIITQKGLPLPCKKEMDTPPLHGSSQAPLPQTNTPPCSNAGQASLPTTQSIIQPSASYQDKGVTQINQDMAAKGTNSAITPSTISKTQPSNKTQLNPSTPPFEPTPSVPPQSIQPTSQSIDQIEQIRKDSVEIQASSNCFKVCHTSDCQDMPTSSLIMPVWIRQQDNSRKMLTYAVLDDQSDTCFITESVCRELGVKGPETVIELGTMHAVQDIKTQKISGLVISPEDKSVDIPLPKSYSREQIPVRREQIPTAEMAKKWDHLKPIANKIPPYRADLCIGLLIGNNCVQAIKPRDVDPGKPRDLYAIRTVLGWGIIGATNNNGCNQTNKHVSNCNRIFTRDILTQNTTGLEFISHKPTKEVINPVAVRKMFEQDFSERETRKKPLSQEDRKFMEKTTSAIHISEDGHYELPLPFREDNVSLPYNRTFAESRLDRLKRRFANDGRYKNDYVDFIQDMIEKGYAEKVPKVEGNAWYIPHHGVYQPRKPTKIRVVFDCSAKYHEESLNRHLLQGPDLTNTLIGVLCRFRQDRVAFTCDIEAMFHQVRVNEEHRDYLRFLWWTGGDTSKEPDDYRMTVHLFGATSSPGCSNLALKTTADDNEEEFGSDAAKFLRNDFYVDDGLKSSSTVEEATALVKNSVEMCLKGGFRLHKFLSNERRVIESVAVENRAAEVKELDLDHDVLPMDRVLGVQWCVETDDFQFRITLKDRPLTRRGVLATVGSIYDPLGFVAPVLLTGKRILQLLCKANADWDDPLPEELRTKWERWRTDIYLLEKIKIPRCFKLKEFGSLKMVELHHFSDVSTDGYGQCSYLRLTNEENRVQCSLVMGKSRVAPLRQVSIPRLELTAALVSVKISETLQNGLDYDKIEEIYWTDSKVVLGYINNEARRFHVFVANRVQQIRDHTNPDQWHYIESKINPADDASRGLKASEIITNSRWITGPDFLYE